MTIKQLACMFSAATLLATSSAFAADATLSATANKTFMAGNAKKSGVVTMPGIQYRAIKFGTGAQPGRHDCATVSYKGSLINGKVFDQTKPGETATFGVNQVIGGWTEVLQLMHVGDDWEVVIPPGLAYGKNGVGDGLIPGDQTLVFEITLLKVAPPPDGGSCS